MASNMFLNRNLHLMVRYVNQIEPYISSKDFKPEPKPYVNPINP